MLPRHYSTRPLKYVDPTGHMEAQYRVWGTEYYYNAENPTPKGFLEFSEKKREELVEIPPELALFMISMACEPVDWGMTLNEWFHGNFSFFDLAGLFPLINSQMAKKIGNGIEVGVDFLRNGVNKIKSVFNSADNVAKNISSVDSQMFKMNLQLFGNKNTISNSYVEVLEGMCKLTSTQIDDYLAKAINNPNRNKFVLGVTGSYDEVAEELGYTYFKMSDDVWDGLVNAAGNNYDEIWKVNKTFLDEQIEAGKEILLSNDPTIGYYLDNGTPRFFQREIDYLTGKGYEFTKTVNGLWKASQ